MGPQKASVDSPLSVAKIKMPADVRVRYRKIKLEGSGAVNKGSRNLRKT
jgi:hypothetical protein